MILFQLQRLHL